MAVKKELVRQINAHYVRTMAHERSDELVRSVDDKIMAGAKLVDGMRMQLHTTDSYPEFSSDQVSTLSVCNAARFPADFF